MVEATASRGQRSEIRYQNFKVSPLVTDLISENNEGCLYAPECMGGKAKGGNDEEQGGRGDKEFATASPFGKRYLREMIFEFPPAAPFCKRYIKFPRGWEFDMLF